MKATECTIPALNGITACEHPDFPLKVKSGGRTKGKDYPCWARKIRNVSVCFGQVSRDPTGEIAWRLYLAEKNAWEVKHDPRAGFRLPAVVQALGRWYATWYVSGPLE